MAKIKKTWSTKFGRRKITNEQEFSLLHFAFLPLVVSYPAGNNQTRHLEADLRKCITCASLEG